MSFPSADFQAFLQKQRLEYIASLPQRRAALEAAWQQAVEGRPGARQVLEREAHNLAGSGATFGFPALGDAARSLEQGVESLAGRPVTTLEPLLHAVQRQIEEAGRRDPAAAQ